MDEYIYNSLSLSHDGLGLVREEVKNISEMMIP